MKSSLKVARLVQLIGAVLLIMGIVSCNTVFDKTGTSNQAMMMSFYFLGGFALIVGASIFEWFTKE